MGQITEHGIAAEVITLLAQSGALTRRMISRLLDRVNDASLSQSIRRLTDRGCIAVIRRGRHQYLCLSDEGWRCADRIGATYMPCIQKLSLENTYDQRRLVQSGIGIYAAHEMGLKCLPSEKLHLGAFAEYLMANIEIDAKREDESNYCLAAQKANQQLSDLITHGVYYTIDELNAAFLASNKDAIGFNRSSVIGVAFMEHRIALCMLVTNKRQIVVPFSESRFTDALTDIFGGCYQFAPRELSLRKIDFEVWLFASGDYLLPTIFHGVADGIVNRKKREPPYQLAPQSRKPESLSVDYLASIGAVYWISLAERDRARRQSFLTDKKQSEAGKIERLRKMLKTNAPIIACDNLDLCQLRQNYNSKKVENIFVIGREDPMWVDMISRCLRKKLAGYYRDTADQAQVSYTRYSATGRPLIGNTNRIDYDAPLRPKSARRNRAKS